VSSEVAKSNDSTEPQFGKQYKLIGKNYVTADLHAKVTGNAKYAEDFRAEGMLFCKLLLSPLPHSRVIKIDASEALAMPGVKAILTADDLPAPADNVTDNGTVIKASKWGERALAKEPVYQGEPVLAVAAVDELTAADAIEKIQIDFEPLPFATDPLDTLRPGGPNPRTDGNVWVTTGTASGQQELLVAALRDASSLAYLRFEGGVDTLLNALIADSSLFTAELSLTQTRRDELLSLVQLYKALGGGWQG
jgi:CO/xanthine dehydrogenase Mo-binding subunit